MGRGELRAGSVSILLGLTRESQLNAWSPIRGQGSAFCKAASHSSWAAQGRGWCHFSGKSASLST